MFGNVGRQVFWTRQISFHSAVFVEDRKLDSDFPSCTLNIVQRIIILSMKVHDVKVGWTLSARRSSLNQVRFKLYFCLHDDLCGTDTQ